MMKEKLDPEGLSIILIKSFMEEFFPREEKANHENKTFELMHYNGIKRSNNNNKVLIYYMLYIIYDMVNYTTS